MIQAALPIAGAVDVASYDLGSSAVRMNVHTRFGSTGSPSILAEINA